jgi:hypothetical protein
MTIRYRGSVEHFHRRGNNQLLNLLTIAIQPPVDIHRLDRNDRPLVLIVRAVLRIGLARDVPVPRRPLCRPHRAVSRFGSTFVQRNAQDNSFDTKGTRPPIFHCATQSIPGTASLPETTRATYDKRPAPS